MQAFDILLDSKTTGVQQTVHMYQGENRLKLLRITLLQNGRIYPVPSGCSAALRGEKPDGTAITHGCSIRSGQIFYLPTAQTTAALGSVRCQLFLYGDTGALLATPEFEIDVAEPLPGVELPESSDESTAPDMQTLLALSLSPDGKSLCLNGDPVNLRIPSVDTLPIEAEPGDVVYLADTGLYCYVDAWRKLTADSLEETTAALSNAVSALSDTVTSLSDTVSAQQNALPTAQEKAAWDTAVSDVSAIRQALPTSAQKAAWTAAANAAHEHANQNTLNALSAQNGRLLWNRKPVDIEVVDTLPAEVTVGKLIFNTTGHYFYLGRQRSNGTKDWYAVIDHSHINKSAIDKFQEINSKILWNDKRLRIETVNALPQSAAEDDVVYLPNDGLYFFSAGEWIALTKNWLTSLSAAQSSTLAKIDEQNGQMLFDGCTVAVHAPDDVTPLGFNTYDSLYLRDDFENIGSLDDVPIYITENLGFGIGLYEDAENASTCDSIVLTDTDDDNTGLPVRFIAVTINNVRYARWSRDCTMLGTNLEAGVWYNNNVPVSAPDLSGFHPTALEVCGDWYDDLSGLPAKAASALRSLSQCVNVSATAMGTIEVKENAVQRLAAIPVTGRHYACTAHVDVTLPLPPITWTGEKREFWLDLDCASSINLTFTETVNYANGNNVDTTRGLHRLHFYVFEGDDKWTVEEMESVSEITEDVVPEYVIPFRSISADQLRAVLKYGYGDGNGAWCVRKNGVVLEFFHPGDVRSVTLTNGQEVTMRIIGIEHDDLPLGGKAALTCDFKELVTVQSYAPTNNYGASDMRSRAQSIVNLLPDWIKEIVPTVVKKYDTDGHTVNDKVWAFASGEVGAPVVSGREGVGTVYPVFTDNASRSRENANGAYAAWLLRSSGSYGGNYDMIQNTGAQIGSYSSTNQTSIAVGFCLNVN